MSIFYIPTHWTREFLIEKSFKNSTLRWNKIGLLHVNITEKIKKRPES